MRDFPTPVVVTAVVRGRRVWLYDRLTARYVEARVIATYRTGFSAAYEAGGREVIQQCYYRALDVAWWLSDPSAVPAEEAAEVAA